MIMAGCIAHARNGRISTSGLKSDVTNVFLDPDFRPLPADVARQSFWAVLAGLVLHDAHNCYFQVFDKNSDISHH